MQARGLLYGWNIQRECDKLYCLEEFKCCRMIGKRDDIITYIISWDYAW